MCTSATATKIAEAVDRNFITTAALAAWLKIGRDQVVEAYDVLEAAGYTLHRQRGVGGGIEVLRRPVLSRSLPLQRAA